MFAHAMLLLLGGLIRLASATPIVDLGYTKYGGTSLPAGVNQFLGMRYAAPPLGNLRFRAPADPVPVKGTQDATAVRSSTQQCSYTATFMMTYLIR
jgi:carboxylesterase type B